MRVGSMRNMIVLRNLPSNLIEEAFVVLKENKKVKKYQYIDKEKGAEGSKKENGDSDYIVKEAENIISQYISNIETKSPKWKNNMKKLENRYKKSLRLNIVLLAITIASIIISLI